MKCTDDTLTCQDEDQTASQVGAASREDTAEVSPIYVLYGSRLVSYNKCLDDLYDLNHKFSSDCTHCSKTNLHMCTVFLMHLSVNTLKDILPVAASV